MPSPLRIEQVELYSSPIKLREPFIISLGPLHFAENVVVIIRTNQGISGIGECSPFRTIHGETMETAMIVGKELAGQLLHSDPLEIEDCISLMNKLFYSNSSIKSAFDLALHDILGKFHNQPLYKLLGANESRILFTDYTVSLAPVEKMVADAKKIKSEGFKFIKIKLGDSAEKDIERIRRMREAVGMEIPFRIDANQGWNPDSALKILNEISSLNIQHCEEPIPRWAFMQLKSLREKSPIPIMADESCCDENDAERLIQLNACDSLNVKLGKSSGIFRARKILTLAEQAHLPVQMGGFLESRIGFTASAHLALSSPAVQFIDFDTPLMFAEDPVEGGIKYGDHGSIQIPDAPGLGVWIDESYLSRQNKHIIH